jgi:hypothetical protein
LILGVFLLKSKVGDLARKENVQQLRQMKMHSKYLETDKLQTTGFSNA